MGLRDLRFILPGCVKYPMAMIFHYWQQVLRWRPGCCLRQPDPTCQIKSNHSLKQILTYFTLTGWQKRQACTLTLHCLKTWGWMLIRPPRKLMVAWPWFRFTNRIQPTTREYFYCLNVREAHKHRFMLVFIMQCVTVRKIKDLDCLKIYHKMTP